MSRYDVVLRGGTVVSDYSSSVLDLGIQDGTIVVVDQSLDGDGAIEIDVTGQLVLPGSIDPHVHFNEPGRVEWEGWASGSRALAAGGGTCAIEMPLNAHPPTLDRASFDQKVTAAQASSIVDFALWGGLTPTNLDCLDELADAGVIGYKAFMSRSGTEDFMAADDLTLFRGMERAATLGLPVAVHAESDVMTAGLAAEAVAQNRLSLRDYARSRPIVAELEAISRSLILAREAGCALHIVHVSSGRGVALIAEARASGIDVTCETCPHYLLFTEDDLERIGNLMKCAPPLRGAEDLESLWSMVQAGEVDMIASDHSPSPPSMKSDSNGFAVWGGISGCQHLRPAMITSAAKRHIPLSDIVRMTSSTVAARFRLARKGDLGIGKDADVTWGVMQPDREIVASEVAYRHPASAWDGSVFNFRQMGTMLRGDLIFRGGTFLKSSGGRLVRPAAI